jgi:hypothetical protein
MSIDDFKFLAEIQIRFGFFPNHAQTSDFNPTLID